MKKNEEQMERRLQNADSLRVAVKLIESLGIPKEVGLSAEECASRLMDIEKFLGSGWQPIDTLDRSLMHFVLVHEAGAIRLYLWHPNGFWEHPLGRKVLSTDPCNSPTHWMPLPEPPNAS